MEGLHEILIQKVTVKDLKEWKKGDKSGTYTPVGIQAGGMWYNQNIFEEKDVEKIKAAEGKKMLLIFGVETYKDKEYKKFTLPKPADVLADEVRKIKVFIRVAMVKFPELKDLYKEEINK